VGRRLVEKKEGCGKSGMENSTTENNVDAKCQNMDNRKPD
jgi:hypothetical protein